MKVIVVRKGNSASLSLDSERTGDRLTLGLLVLLPCLAGVLVAWFVAGWGQHLEDNRVIAQWQNSVDEQAQLVEDARQRVNDELTALTIKVAELQARMLRLDALGEQVATSARLDNGEFDFSQRPALGGPLASSATALEQEMFSADSVSGAGASGLRHELDQLSALLANREQQLSMLDQQLLKQRVVQDSFIAGRPISGGWMSSGYGFRTDPFNGRKAWHDGVDFAGKAGAEVNAVAGGVVTWSGKRSGYGRMVEINHGDGYSTRYAHNEKNLVNEGDTVSKGQTVAVMGSSGRSTGPHVHFEVLRHGKSIDPIRYIHRASR